MIRTQEATASEAADVARRALLHTQLSAVRLVIFLPLPSFLDLAVLLYLFPPALRSFCYLSSGIFKFYYYNIIVQIYPTFRSYFQQEQASNEKGVPMDTIRNILDSHVQRMNAFEAQLREEVSQSATETQTLVRGTTVASGQAVIQLQQYIDKRLEQSEVCFIEM